MTAHSTRFPILRVRGVYGWREMADNAVVVLGDGALSSRQGGHG